MNYLSTRCRNRVWRSTMAAALAVMTVATVLVSPAGRIATAQDAVPASASITPASAPLYIAFDLDTTAPMWTLAAELVERAGLTESTSEGISDAISGISTSAESADLESALFMDGEVAIVATSLNAASGAVEGLGAAGGMGSDLLATPVAGDDTQGVVLISSPKDIDAGWQAAQDELAKTSATLGQALVDSEYNGVTISSVADPDGAANGNAIARVGDFIVLAATAGDIEPIIDTHAGTIDPLSTFEPYTETMAALQTEWIMSGFINGVALLDLPTEGEPEVADLLSTVRKESGYTSFVAFPTEAGFRIDTVSVMTAGSLEAIANFDSTMAGRVPADTLVFVDGMNLGQASLLQGIATLFVRAMSSFDSGDATPVPAVEAFETAGKLLGFNLQSDFLDQLRGEWSFAMWGLDLNDLSRLGVVLASETDQTALVTDALSKLSLLIQAGAQGVVSVETRTVGDSLVNSVDLTDSGLPLTLDYGVVDADFIVGLGTGMDTFVAGPAGSLTTNADYIAAMAELPAEHNGVVFLNVAGLVPVITSAGEAMTGGIGETLDNHPKCGDYATLEEAQAAYDENMFDLFDLDQDFDGIACEDYLSTAATPVDAPLAAELGGFRAIATVGYDLPDGMTGSSTLILIAD